MHAGVGIELSVLTGGLCRSAGGPLIEYIRVCVCVSVYGNLHEW